MNLEFLLVVSPNSPLAPRSDSFPSKTANNKPPYSCYAYPLEVLMTEYLSCSVTVLPAPRLPAQHFGTDRVIPYWKDLFTIVTFSFDPASFFSVF